MSESVVVDESKVLRRLGCLEYVFDKQYVFMGLLVQTRSFLVDIPKGELTLDLLKQACTHWVKHLPFLGAEIKRDIEHNKAWFVNMNDSDKFNFDSNIELTESENPNEWVRLLETEVDNKFDVNKGHLWRIKVIKIKNKPADIDYNYAFVLTTQHSITDGRNSVEIMRRFFNIIGALLENKTCDEMNSVVESPHTVEDLVKQVHELPPNWFPNSKLDQKSRLSEALVDPDAQPLSKFQHFCIKSDVFNKLNARMKANSKEAKLTGLFSVIISLAFKEAMKKYDVKDIPIDPIQISYLGSVRDKLKVPSAQMGVYLGGYELTLANDDTLNYESIWPLAEKNSIELHQAIADPGNLNFILFMDKNFEFMMKSPDGGYSDTQYNFKLSNYGLLKNTDVPDVIKIRQHYIRTYNPFGVVGSNLIMSMCTVDGNLCWVCSYNEKMISSRVVTEVLQNIQDTMHKLIQ